MPLLLVSDRWLKLSCSTASGVAWLVPNDYQVANHSIDAGVPLMIGAPRSKLAKSFEEYAEKLASGVEVSKETDAAHAPAPTH